jgi:hypothetical protein
VRQKLQRAQAARQQAEEATRKARETTREAVEELCTNVGMSYADVGALFGLSKMAVCHIPKRKMPKSASCSACARWRCSPRPAHSLGSPRPARSGAGILSAGPLLSLASIFQVLRGLVDEEDDEEEAEAARIESITSGE